MVDGEPGVTAAEPPWLRHYPEHLDWRQPFAARPLSALLDQAVSRFAGRPFIDFLDRRLSYGEIDARVDRAARGLQALGLRKGMKVGLCLPNCPYSVIGFFAILRAGGTVVNYNPLYTAREIERQIGDSETDIMITIDVQILVAKLGPLLRNTRLKAVVVGRMADCLPFPQSLLYPWVRRREVAALPDDPAFVRFERLTANDGRFEPVPIDPDQDIAVIQYTGGTTGVPKGAAHTHASLAINAEQIAAWAPDFEEGAERILGVLPLFHVLALSTVLSLGIKTGAELVLLPRFDLDQVMHAIQRKRPTIVPGVPTMYNAISAHPAIARFDLTSIKLCISGGAPLPIEVKETFERQAGCILLEGYGLTEAPVTHCNPVRGGGKSGSVGLPLQGTTVEILSLEDGATVLPAGERGEICISGPQVMSGYWRQDDAVGGTIRNGRLHTGDVGYLDQDGYTFVVDRLKELIICSGYNVYPRVVEEALYDHPDVAEAAVCGVADSYRGETVKAYVVRRAGATLTEAALLAFLEPRLSRIEMPKIVEFRDQLPKSAVGKILKQALLHEERERAVAS